MEAGERAASVRSLRFFLKASDACFQTPDLLPELFQRKGRLLRRRQHGLSDEACCGKRYKCNRSQR